MGFLIFPLRYYRFSFSEVDAAIIRLSRQFERKIWIPGVDDAFVVYYALLSTMTPPRSIPAFHISPYARLPFSSHRPVAIVCSLPARSSLLLLYHIWLQLPVARRGQVAKCRTFMPFIIGSESGRDASGVPATSCHAFSRFTAALYKPASFTLPLSIEDFIDLAGPE